MEINITLDTNKAKRYVAEPVWIRQDDTPDTIVVTASGDLAITATSTFEFDSTKYDQQIVKDSDQSKFSIVKGEGNKVTGFKYVLPKEMYQSSGSTTATYFRVDGTSTSNFIIVVQRADGVGGEDSNSLISDANSILNDMNSIYKSMQEMQSNASIDFDEMTKKVADLKTDLDNIEKLINDNNVITKSDAETIITNIVKNMDLDTDDKISDADVLAKIQKLGAK